MKNTTILIVLLTFFMVSCNSQKKMNKNIVLAENDTIKPKTNYSVHKEYDENGNLISIDSTYTSFYSNIKNDSALEKEIFKNFRSNFNDHFTSIDSLFMNGLNGKMMIMPNDFYTDDFFLNNYQLNQKSVEGIFKRMDSLKNEFYKNQKNIIEQDNKNQL